MPAYNQTQWLEAMGQLPRVKAMMTSPRTAALSDAADILRSEGNQLAQLLDSKAFDAMHYRVRIAVESEMKRVREIADIIRPQDGDPENLPLVS